MEELLTDLGSLFKLIGGGLSTLMEYMTSGVDYILKLLVYVPDEISVFMSAVLLLSIILFYLGRSDNH